MITTMEENYDENFRTSDIAVRSRDAMHNVPSRDEIGALRTVPRRTIGASSRGDWGTSHREGGVPA